MPGLRFGTAALTLTAALAPVMPGFAGGPPVDVGTLVPLVRIAFAYGFGGPLSGRVCTALGITQNNQSFPVEQLSSTTRGMSRTFNVSRHRGRLDVIIALKLKDETLIFLTTAKGDLEKAVIDHQGQPPREIPAVDARAAFEAEKSWWLDTWMPAHYSTPGRQ